MTREICSPASDSRSGRMNGMPPATAASNSRSTPASSAMANSSDAAEASSALLAVTTGLPLVSALATRVAGRLDAAHQLDHHVDVGILDHLRGVGGVVRLVQISGAGLGQVADGDGPDLEPDARALLDDLASGGEQPDEGASDDPAAEQPDPDRRC